MSERELWIAVVHQAMHDCLSSKDEINEEARQWLFADEGDNNYADLLEVMSLASVDLEEVRKIVRTIYNSAQREGLTLSEKQVMYLLSKRVSRRLDD